MTVTPIIQMEDLSKRFVLRHNRSGQLKVQFLGLLHKSQRESREEFWALKGISLSIGRGESVGIIGRNGSGKSTLLKLIAGIHAPTNGHLRLARGARLGTMIELGIGFHAELTGQENVYLNAAIHGLSKGEITGLYETIVEYSGLKHFMDVPLKNYSSGMHMRLGFAIAANLDPDILLLDEVFAVGDEEFQQQCMATLKTFAARGKTILFVSHASAAVRMICDRVCLLDEGELLFDGDVESGLYHYRRVAAGTGTEVGHRVPGRSHVRLSADASEAELDQAWHRIALGGLWSEVGAWEFDFMRRQGLEPHHYLLEMGCGSLAGSIHFLTFMDQSHYWGFDQNRDLFEAGVRIEAVRANVRPERGHFVVNDDFDLHEIPHVFEMALTSSLFNRLPLKSIGRVVANVVGKLQPGGRFFVTWLENPDERNLEPIVHAAGITSYPDAEPYHHTFEKLATVCEAVGARVERVDDSSHPRGDAIMVVTRS